MLRTTFAAALLASALPAAALDLEALSPAESDAFGAAVRAYLLENPEVLMEAIAVLEERQSAAAAATDQELVATHAEAIFNDGFSFVGGNPEGDVTIVEFLDYRCGYCKKAFPEVKELIESDGNIRIIIKEFPILGEQSVRASRYAVAVQQTHGDAAYEAVHDALMELRGDVTERRLETLSKEHALNHPAIEVAMDSAEVNDILNANHALASALQINGTPSFIMGGDMLRGYAPLDVMEQIVAEIRASGK